MRETMTRFFLATLPLGAVAPGGEEAVRAVLALFLILVGLVIAFLLLVVLLRVTARHQRSQRTEDKPSLRLDAWHEAGERAEAYRDQAAEPPPPEN